MSDPVQEQLLGYVLGCLDESERAMVESNLANDPRLRHQLSLARQKLRPLSNDREAIEPPPGLAARTCRLVAVERNKAELQGQAGAAPQPAPTSEMAAAPLPGLSPHAAPPSFRGRFSMADVAIAAGILISASVLVVPAVQSSRFSAGILSCQSRLRDVGMALESYSQRHAGYFPVVPASGKFAAAGIYAPTLLEDRLLENDQALICPTSLNGKTAAHIPTMTELRTAPEVELPRLRETMGGSFGYNLGYRQNGRYLPIRNAHRAHLALAADAPDPYGRGSRNHGGRGQNVLFEDGRVDFLDNPRLPNGDDIYLNDVGLVEAGLQPDDAVLAPSGTPPLRLLEAAP